MSIEPITKQPDGGYPPGKRFQQCELLDGVIFEFLIVSPAKKNSDFKLL